FGLGSNFWTQRMDTSVNLLLPQGQELMNSDQPMSQYMDQERRAEESGAAVGRSGVSGNAVERRLRLAPHLAPGSGSPPAAGAARPGPNGGPVGRRAGN